jgi:hypothetical protein
MPFSSFLHMSLPAVMISTNHFHSLGSTTMSIPLVTQSPPSILLANECPLVLNHPPYPCIIFSIVPIMSTRFIDQCCPLVVKHSDTYSLLTQPCPSILLANECPLVMMYQPYRFNIDPIMSTRYTNQSHPLLIEPTQRPRRWCWTCGTTR